MTTSASALEEALVREAIQQEAQFEKRSCLILAAIVAACYALMLGLEKVSPALLQDIGWLAVGAVMALLGLAGAIHWGWHSPLTAYGNVLLQVGIVSGAIYLDSRNQGPAYALSSMPPLAYALVIGLTAFRLRPALTFFAGAVSAGQFLLLYLIWLRPAIRPEELEQWPSLGLGVTLMKVIILAGVGLAAGLAAWRLEKEVSKGVQRARRLDSLKRVFGRYVSPAVAERALREEALQKPRRARAVIMFGDLRGFTAYASVRSPEEVVTLLNQYLEAACAVIERQGGMVNKFIGDGFLALFGIPVAQPDQAAAALRAAQALIRELEPILQPHGLAFGCAVHEGEVMAGEVGSAERCEFTVIGDAVNTAARVEGLNRELGTICLVTAPVAAGLIGDFHLENRGPQAIRGLAEPLEVFSLRL
jgi:adenylate cyclase